MAYLLEYSRTKERNNRNYRNDSHIAKEIFDLVRNTPKCYRNHAHKRHPVLFKSKCLTCGTNRFDLQFLSIRRGAWTIYRKKQQPNKENGHSGHWQCNSEPLKPVDRRVHLI